MENYSASGSCLTMGVSLKAFSGRRKPGKSRTRTGRLPLYKILGNAN